MNAGHAYIHALRNATMERRGSLDIWTFNNTYLAEQIRHSKADTNHPDDIGSPVVVYDGWSQGLHPDVLDDADEDAALAPLVQRDPRGRAFLIPTMTELAIALTKTDSDDPGVISDVLGLDALDAELAHVTGWCHTFRYNPGWYGAQQQITEADYIALRAAAHQAYAEYVFALLDAGIPADAVIQLCALPPMPVEYAIAMFDGGES